MDNIILMCKSELFDQKEGQHLLVVYYVPNYM